MSALDVFAIDGTRAVVTGGNRGIGQAIALTLAQAGASVVIAGRDAAQNQAAVSAARDAGLELHAVTADVARREDADRLAAEAAEQLGGLDLFVNNAGACVHAPALEVTDDDWADVLDVNISGVWHCSRAAARVMKDAGGGAIVNIGSISAMIVNRPQWQPAYNASKAAVHQLTKSLAAEWAPYGIRVNAIAPGYVRTDMAPVDRPEFKRYWIDDTPQQRAAAPEEIAPLVVFLASAAASFITGSCSSPTAATRSGNHPYGQLEVEYGEVLRHPPRFGRLGDDDRAVLEVPAQDQGLAVVPEGTPHSGLGAVRTAVSMCRYPACRGWPTTPAVTSILACDASRLGWTRSGTAGTGVRTFGIDCSLLVSGYGWRRVLMARRSSMAR